MPGPKKQFPAWLQLRVTPELVNRIDRLRRQVSRSRWVREAVEQRLKREEKRQTRKGVGPVGIMDRLRTAREDDPIYKEGLTVFTPRSARSSTPSTPSSPRSTGSKPGQGSRRKKAKGSQSNPSIHAKD